MGCPATAGRVRAGGHASSDRLGSGERSEPRQRGALTIGSYDRDRLDVSDLAPTWVEQLRRWLEEATEAGLPEPTAMVLATAGADGTPGARSVLLKGLDERGLVFFTNLRSRKGRELAENPRATLVFPWPALQRQVVIDGHVRSLPAAESDAYWEARPPGSRLGALASPQSEAIASRDLLERRYREAAERYPEEGAVPPRPQWWGGLLLAPTRVELWQGRPDRLHDRLRYRAVADGWTVERLAP